MARDALAAIDRLTADVDRLKKERGLLIVTVEKERQNRLVSAEEWRAECDRLTAQLPAGMQHCTILFKECDKGHGRLTATNWIDHGCDVCERDRLTAGRDAAIAKAVEDNTAMFRRAMDKLIAKQNSDARAAVAAAWDEASSFINSYSSDPDETGEIATALAKQFREKAAVIRARGQEPPT